MAIRSLIINPGSTSTKIGVFEDETQILDKTLRHSTEEIAQFATSLVGSCNGGANKIAYARGTASEQAATLRALAASRPPAEPAAPLSTQSSAALPRRPCV